MALYVFVEQLGFVCLLFSVLTNIHVQVVIDVRNNYETRIGKFKGAVDPCTTAFREFPSWVEDQFQLSERDGKNSEVEPNSSNEGTKNQTEIPKEKMPQRVAMYCTGGIRCEKASSFLLSKGFKEVITWMIFMPPFCNLWLSCCLSLAMGYCLVDQILI